MSKTRPPSSSTGGRWNQDLERGSQMRKLNKLALVLSVLIIAVLAVPTLANVSSDNVENHIANVNEHILREVSKAEQKALAAYSAGDFALVEEIMAALAEKAQKLSELAVEWADRQGYTAECYEIEVVIGDVSYLIDPIHILW